MTDIADMSGDRTRLAQDLDYALDLARAGREAPLLGGPIGLMWTGLATVALTLHGLALVGVLRIPEPMLGLIWLAYGVVGTALSYGLGKRFANTPGARTFANRVSEATWTASGILIAAIAVSAVVAFSLGLFRDYTVFAFIVPFAFGVSSVSNAVLARITGHGYLKFAAWGAGVATVVTLMMATQPAMYLVAAAGVLVSGVIPSWIELRKAR